METLKNAIDAWKRHKAELEEIVSGMIVQAVFIHRYRDANASIRKECLDALSEICLIRPDIFLVDMYLKYFAWMASDKNSKVRIAALKGLLAPFLAYQEQSKQPLGSSRRGFQNFKIDISNMQHVTVKFLPRLVDCTEDSEDVKVQEVAMKLLLEMLKAGFLDDWDDDNAWDAVNMKALDIYTSPEVRRGALYFVLEQLDAFDFAADGHANEKKQLEQLTEIAKW
jgi:cohesin complex subunit SA-1/2